MNDERREAKALERIADDLDKLLVRLSGPAATGFSISQVIGGSIMAILGIVKGAVGTFTGVPSPAGSALQAGNVPTWSADDSNVSLTPSADGSAVSVATSATDTAASFNLTQSGVSSSGAAISSTVNVPLTGAAPVPATGFSINQTS
jgi:hypothetical protein